MVGQVSRPLTTPASDYSPLLFYLAESSQHVRPASTPANASPLLEVERQGMAYQDHRTSSHIIDIIGRVDEDCGLT